jgi:phosphatidylinositol alpha-1,6-mannosyltransferase
MALVTSGFGPGLGGIGVVSAGVVEALAHDATVTVWRHRPHWPPRIRSAALVLRAVAGSLHSPEFVLFTHVDLARMMAVLPHLKGVPYGVLIYGVEVWQSLDRRRRTALERAHTILSISAYTARKAREANPWLPETRVVWLGVADRRLPPAREKRPVVLMLGRMAKAERYKGHDVLIDAWPRVLAAVPGAHLLIVGDGDDRGRLEAKAAQTPGIRFTGFLSDDSLERLLETVAVVVSISSGEGFGLAEVEAAARALPVVALKGTVTEELFPDGSGHVLLDSAAPQPLAEALTALLVDPDRAKRIGAAGRRRVEEVFTIDRFHDRLRFALSPLWPIRQRELCRSHES